MEQVILFNSLAPSGLPLRHVIEEPGKHSGDEQARDDRPGKYNVPFTDIRLPSHAGKEVKPVFFAISFEPAHESVESTLFRASYSTPHLFEPQAPAGLFHEESGQRSSTQRGNGNDGKGSPENRLAKIGQFPSIRLVIHETSNQGSTCLAHCGTRFGRRTH
ncbi:hypothetical protein SDC9_192515 [bioreactor metagenome]|uniref:Uncharacterized protein n=1 Tax=bioreactor metagenome TaxID=1076179 RepID=A0A645I114_9ZZZZ